MAENMMNGAHKGTSDKYRDGYERTFGTGHKYPEEHKAEMMERTRRRHERKKG